MPRHIFDRDTSLLNMPRIEDSRDESRYDPLAAFHGDVRSLDEALLNEQTASRAVALLEAELTAGRVRPWDVGRVLEVAFYDMEPDLAESSGALELALRIVRGDDDSARQCIEYFAFPDPGELPRNRTAERLRAEIIALAVDRTRLSNIALLVRDTAPPDGDDLLRVVVDRLGGGVADSMLVTEALTSRNPRFDEWIVAHAGELGPMAQRAAELVAEGHAAHEAIHLVIDEELAGRRFRGG